MGEYGEMGEMGEGYLIKEQILVLISLMELYKLLWGFMKKRS
jgi:hypothetical protein